MKKTKKMMAGVVATLMAVSVTACNNQEEGQNNYDEKNAAKNRPAEPTDVSCGDWDWDDDTGTYYCDDRRSSNFGMYYLMGQMFNSRSALTSSSKYKTYRQSYRPNTKNEEYSSGSGGGGSYSGSGSSSENKSYKSGIGSGSKGGFGG
ncbi:hypothetical protein [Bacillus massiliigorillae]|uniref:hypothetical protein n=1 Tax=Bacillus massiliigorillae TaxID=1243664 RepID=UPI0003A8815E|nr:hypothetical protein [Bacillus massiliigorillae]